ncbi:thiamine pyrophosphate-binding protein, partial [Kitasatospora phosalacinea]|uniref:thiamine pyrophosphate-binding protein n=1 Tax=Kitasatospora phosalacinea TaxID=2065 RepID=UPI00255628AB
MTQLTDSPAATGPAATAVPAPARPANASSNAPGAVPANVPPAEGAYLTGAEALVHSLETVGVDTVFGIPGGAILPAYDPLMDSTRLRHVLVRHEQGAGHAATGYAQATGRVGVCMATSGPGATNLVTPIAD